jgi:iron complex outermembrane receptor protein
VLTVLRTKAAYKLNGSKIAPPFSQTSFSPKFGLIYQPIKDALSLFANFQNGFQNPGVYKMPTA